MKKILLVLLLISAFIGCKKDDDSEVHLDDGVAIQLKFRGRQFSIKLVSLREMMLSGDYSWSTDVGLVFDNGTTGGVTHSSSQKLGVTSELVSTIAVYGASKEIALSLGACKLGDPVGKYEANSARYQEQYRDAQTYYFGLYQSALLSFADKTWAFFDPASGDVWKPIFIDRTDGSKQYLIDYEKSSITVSRSDADKLEGTFDLYLMYGDHSEHATGAFSIDK